MKSLTRIQSGALVLVTAILSSLLLAPPASANITCLKDSSGGSNPVESLWSREDRYSSIAGMIWIEYNGVNMCGRTVRGWAFRVEFVDAFGDTFYTGTGKVWLKKPLAPGKKFKLNRKGGYGVFDLYGSTWKNFQDWRRQFPPSSPSNPATWRYTVTSVV